MKPKICITFSSGGHYSEAKAACVLLSDYERYYVTFRTPHLERKAQNEKFFYVVHPRHNPFRLFANCVQSLFILLKERPDIIISAGADVTVPTFILGKLLGKKTVYIESGGNVYTPSLTGKLVYRFADLFLVQWPPLKKVFPKAFVGGPLF